MAKNDIKFTTDDLKLIQKVLRSSPPSPHLQDQIIDLYDRITKVLTK